MKSIIDLSDDINLVSFFLQYRNVYIYGAGKYGRCCADWFSDLKIRFVGFIVSKKNNNLVDGYPVYSYDDICHELGENDCLVLAMGKKNQLEVLSTIGNAFNGILIDITSNERFCYRVNRDVVKLMEVLSKNNPPAKYNHNDDFANILVIRLDRLGDMIWTSAFLRELRRNFPKSRITVVCETNMLPLLDDCPYVDRSIGFECMQETKTGSLLDPEQLTKAKEFARINLQNIKYDVVFLPRGLQIGDMLSNIYLAVFSSASIRISGYYATTDEVWDWYRECMSKLFSVIAEHKYPLHDMEKALNILKAIGCHIKEDYTEIWYKKTPIVAGLNREEMCSLRKKFDFLVAVGLNAQAQVRTWNPNNYKELFAKLGEEFSVCFLLLGNKETQESASVVFNGKYCVDFTGKTNLNDVMQLISNCDLYVGSDTGLKHIAAALKKPVIEISAAFPWGNDNDGLSPKRCAAWRTKYVVIVPSAPKSEVCAKNGYCVSQYSHCINNVSVKSVYNVLSGFLKNYMFINN